MINRLIIFFFFFLLFFKNESQAALHPTSGMELKYKWVSDSTWKVTLIFYVNCEYIGVDPYFGYEFICAHDTTNYALNNWTGPMLYLTENLPNGQPQASEIPKPCVNFQTKCDSIITVNSARSYHVYYLDGLFTIPEKCGLWTFSHKSAVCAMQRDTFVTNLMHPYLYFIESGMNYTDSTIKNSNAELINPIPFYAPVNQPFSYSLAATDIDGDSLVYHIVPTKSRGCGSCSSTLPLTNIPFVSPYSLSEPFNTGGTFHWDSTAAIMSFNAPVAQNPVITLLIDEYRNGVWVGNCMRDIPIVILPVSNPLPQQSALPLTWNNTVMQGVDSFYACAGVPMSFCTLLSSSDTNAIIQSSNTIASGIPNATLTYGNLLTDSVTACVSWTPMPTDTGWHTFTITAKDTNCPALGVNTPQTFVYRIYITNTVSLTGATKRCGDDTLLLTAHGSIGYYNWQVLSGSAGSYQCLNANCDSVKVFPTQNTVYVVNSGTGSVLCPSSDTIQVNYYSDFTLHATDTILCNELNSLALYASTTNNNTTLNYSWLPTTNIQGSNIQSDILVLPSTINYTVTASDNGNCFTHSDISNLIVDKDFYPIVSVSDTSICAGDSIVFTIAGANNANVVWSPVVNISGVNDNPMTAWPTVNTTYQVTITSIMSGCRSDTSIEIHSSKLVADAGPDKVINGSEPVTIGGPNMQYDGTGSLQWFPDEYLHFSYLKYPTVFPPRSTTYYVVLQNKEHTCISIDTVYVIVKCGEMFMPNAFNPNSEWPENRTFGANNKMIQLRYLKIYNRLGNLVFTSHDVENRWDGTYHGSPAASDTYYWMMSGACPSGQTIFQKGDVILIR